MLNVRFVKAREEMYFLIYLDGFKLLQTYLLPTMHQKSFQSKLFSIQKHKDCPICQSNASFILCNGNSYTIKKKRVATWKPLPTSP
jgi:hypothetical protein